MPYFTIFTPAYNCAETIHRVVESVRTQTFRDFEWIIINDGSTDSTSEVLKHIKAGNSDLNIILIEQENRGKHNAWNKAVSLAEGKIFVPADADDSFLPETLTFFNNKWEGFSSDLQQKLSGISVLCLDNETSKIVGTRYPSDGLITNTIELAYKYKISGEKWGCIRTDLLKKLPFPEINLKKVVFPEGYLWISLALEYKVICYNIPLRRYYTTITGLMHTLRKPTLNQSKMNIKFKFWLIKKTGLYILFHSPRDFLSILYSTSLDILFIVRNK